MANRKFKHIIWISYSSTYIGIIWQFYNPKSVIPKIITTLGVIFIITTIIMSIRISFVTTSMFDYIIIMGLAAAGSGLLLKTLFKKRD